MKQIVKKLLLIFIVFIISLIGMNLIKDNNVQAEAYFGPERIQIFNNDIPGQSNLWGIPTNILQDNNLSLWCIQHGSNLTR